MSKSSNFTLGVLTGAMVGAIVALLYAPDTGENTRNRLSYQLGKYTDDLNDLIDKLREEKNQLVSEAKIKGDKVVEEARERAENLIDEAENLLHSIEEARRG